LFVNRNRLSAPQIAITEADPRLSLVSDVPEVNEVILLIS
jgi:hypothetical protein